MFNILLTRTNERIRMKNERGGKNETNFEKVRRSYIFLYRHYRDDLGAKLSICQSVPRKFISFSLFRKGSDSIIVFKFL